MIAKAPETQKQLLINSKKAIGMMTKVNEMLLQDAYCADIAQQINATMGILKKMNYLLLRNHLSCCGKTNLSSKDPKDAEAFLDEFFRVIDVSLKL